MLKLKNCFSVTAALATLLFALSTVAGVQTANINFASMNQGTQGIAEAALLRTVNVGRFLGFDDLDDAIYTGNENILFGPARPIDLEFLDFASST